MHNLYKELKKKQYKYLFLLIIIIIGFISGIILSNILSYNDKKNVAENIMNYFNNLKNGEKLNYLANLINSLKINFIYFILIFIFSLSIIGIILNPFLLYIKSLIIGFTIGILINVYQFSGIILGIFSIFPHHLINLLIYMIMTFYGINISLKVFRFLFLKEQLNTSEFRKKYIKVLGISVILLLFSALYEAFLGDLILKVFTFLIK